MTPLTNKTWQKQLDGRAEPGLPVPIRAQQCETEGKRGPTQAPGAQRLLRPRGKITNRCLKHQLLGQCAVDKQNSGNTQKMVTGQEQGRKNWADMTGTQQERAGGKTPEKRQAGGGGG